MMGTTGTFTFFLFVILQTALGVWLSLKVFLKYKRNWERLKPTLNPNDITEMQFDATTHISVWGVRCIQVFTEWGTGMLFIILTFNPLFGIQHPWFLIMATVWIATFYQFNPGVWNVTAAVDLWPKQSLKVLRWLRIPQAFNWIRNAWRKMRNAFA